MRGRRVKPLFIGEAPSKNEPLPRPLEGRVGRRLSEYAGIAFEEFVDKTERINLLAVRQDTREKGFEFDMEAARMRARDLLPHLYAYTTVVLLGKRVRDAFGVVKDWFEPHYLGNDMGLYEGTTMYVVPHPSGINRWHNDPANRSKMQEFMRKVVQG